ncbi:Putative ParE-like protein (ParDE toxin-antitoxin system) [Magnetospirillum sp. XM-1]|uniref:type II toxin-antitoxin system RelE/ParE family toxin n=1 Tax=Magnetospirillum sp. XM-1 TaxID=1663591 RepID=UPI00073DF6A1|nr:type II toxin-antitoxin system RelE/ParE family toxin [Magnetospirillum sp. XM-1]CUW38624.1 Putative ParE-like protein (ParDE toxin-antitoxin system) [Magnetospirillum sp. XM-1]
MTRRLVFRATAESDLSSLFRFIAETSGPARAGAYLDRIEHACLSLLTFPERGTRRDDIVPGLRTIGFERRVTIAFRVVADTVEMVAIAYAGRSFESDLQED